MSSKKILYIVFASAFIIKLLCGWLLNAGNGPEVFEYEAIANNILNGKGFVDWKPYKHPDLDEVEIGGAVPFIDNTPRDIPGISAKRGD